MAQYTGATAGWTTPPEEKKDEEENDEPEEAEQVAKLDTKNMFAAQAQMPLPDKVFKTIDLFVKLCPDKGLNLHAIKPMI